METENQMTPEDWKEAKPLIEQLIMAMHYDMNHGPQTTAVLQAIEQTRFKIGTIAMEVVAEIQLKRLYVINGVVQEGVFLKQDRKFLRDYKVRVPKEGQ